MPRSSIWNVQHVESLEELFRDDLSNDEMAIRMSKHFGYRITANNVANLLSRMRQPSDPFYRNIPYRQSYERSLSQLPVPQVRRPSPWTTRITPSPHPAMWAQRSAYLSALVLRLGTEHQARRQRLTIEGSAVCAPHWGERFECCCTDRCETGVF